MSDQITGVDPDEHKRHIDNAAYQAAIERAAMQTSGVTIGRWKSTAEIEAEVFGDKEQPCDPCQLRKEIGKR